MYNIDTLQGPIITTMVNEGSVIFASRRFSSLEESLSFFRHGWLLLGEGGSFVLCPNSRDLVEVGALPGMGRYNFADRHGGHIAAEVIVSKARAMEEAYEQQRPLRWSRFGMPSGPYVFRQGPVPGLRRGFRGNSRTMRRPGTFQELAAAAFHEVDEDLDGLSVRIRGRRNRHGLPTAYDDLLCSDYHHNNWKRQRRHQWRAR